MLNVIAMLRAVAGRHLAGRSMVIPHRYHGCRMARPTLPPGSCGGRAHTRWLSSTSPPEQQSQGFFQRKTQEIRTTISNVVSAFKQLGWETLTVGKLMWRGGVRTRGQYKLIERNSNDLAQLVPFTVVAAMPAGES